MRFTIVNLGCKVNRVESDSFAASFIAQGWEQVDVSQADIVIINTCTVTGEAEKKTRKAVRRILKDNANATVIVTGCAAAIDPETYTQMSERVLIQADKAKVEESVYAHAPKSGCESTEGVFASQEILPHSEQTLRVGEGFVTRVGIKIQDGCDNACTYCIVHKARGKAWSREPSLIVQEVKAYEAAGVKELVLTGINIGSYRSGETELASLLQELLNHTEDIRFRLSSIEPHTISSELIHLMASAQGRLCRHLHVPLQSGSKRILREMARPYSLENFRELVVDLYEKMPMLSLSTDIIVGFPSETEEEFEHTLQTAEECRFSKIHIFPYSKRAGTPAAERPDQVSPELIRDRINRLSLLAEKLRREDLLRRRGSKEYVLVEAQGRGTTESYHQIPVPHSLGPGEVLQIVI